MPVIFFSGSTPIVVMEDNVILEEGIGEAMQIAERLVASNGFLRLSGVVDVQRATLAADFPPLWILVRFLAGPLGTRYCALSPWSAHALFEKAKYWTMPVDNYIDAFWLHGMVSKGLQPLRARHDDASRSEISETLLSPSLIMREKVSRVNHFSRRMYDEMRRHTFNLFHQLPPPGAR